MRGLDPKPGAKFGRLTAIRFDHKEHNQFWLFRCDCGTEKVIRLSYVITGTTRSCGCLVSERVSESNSKRVGVKSARYKHGGRWSKFYPLWLSMRQRCSNPNNADFLNYGGRGISVAEEFDEFAVYLDHIMSLPNAGKSGLTIDRIDNDKNYERGNLRWVTHRVQNRNKRTNHLLTVFGETKTLADWADDLRCKVDARVLWKRISRGWEPKRAICSN